MRFLVVGLMVIMCSGCGTIINGRWQTVKINTTPSQAMVKMPDMIENVPTPTSVKIERGQSYLVEITKPGFEDKWIVLQKRKYRSIILADIFLTATIGIFVDWYTGKWNGVSPSKIDVFLDPISDNESTRRIPLQLTDSAIESEDHTIKLKIYKINDAADDQEAFIQSLTR